MPTLQIGRGGSFDAIVDSTASRPDRSEVVTVALDGVRSGVDLDELCSRIRPWLLSVGSTRADRLQLDGLADRLLPEWPARGNAGHQKRRHAVHGAVLAAAGVEPDDTSWWTVDDLWQHALLAVVVFVSAAAERRDTTIADVCDEPQPAG